MKKTSLVCVLIILMPLCANALEVPDSGYVRIRVDREGVAPGLNGVSVFRDAYGNQMVQDSWFTLHVAAGLHFITLTAEGYQTIERSVAVKRDEVTSIELSYDSIPAFTSLSPIITDSLHAELGRVVVFSDPQQADLRLNKLDVQLVTPSEITIHAGNYTLEVSTAGFEPLTHQLELPPAHVISLNFLLRAEPPSPFSPEDFGMEYKPTIPLIEEAEADRLRQKFNNLAETFAIIPLGQGILAKLILGKNDSKGADILIISGAGLTAGAYVLGRILSSKKRIQVHERNQVITRENHEASEQNQNIDQFVQEKNAEAQAIWQLENRDRGRVEMIPQ